MACGFIHFVADRLVQTANNEKSDLLEKSFGSPSFVTYGWEDIPRHSRTRSVRMFQRHQRTLAYLFFGALIDEDVEFPKPA